MSTGRKKRIPAGSRQPLAILEELIGEEHIEKQNDNILLSQTLHATFKKSLMASPAVSILSREQAS